MKTALGMIETKGLIGAIEAADAMLKAAAVRLLDKQLASGGLVTITIAGEVAAVKAAVDAGVAAIRRIAGATLVSEHVIARPDESLEKIVRLSPVENEPVQKEVKPADEGLQQTEVSQKVDTRQSVIRHNEAQLKKMNVDKLRKVAQGLDGIAMSKKDIAKADKNVLMEARQILFTRI